MQTFYSPICTLFLKLSIPGPFDAIVVSTRRPVPHTIERQTNGLI
jgi:hypothetical protein